MSLNAAAKAAARLAPKGARFASSAAYLAAYEERGVDFFKAMQFEGKRSRFDVSHESNAITNYPKLCKKILRVEKAMERRGLIPFVHASPQVMKWPRRMMGGKFRHEERSLEEVKRAVKAGFESGSRDMDPEVRPHVISVSYALCSSMAVADSAWYHGMFLNERPDIRRTFIKACHSVPELHEFFSRVYKGYAEMKYGEFHVFGLSPADLKYAYDCKAWGLPTGNDVAAVAANPKSCSRLLHGHQARLYMAGKMLQDITHVVVNDTDSVNAFCTDEDEPTDPRLAPFFEHEFTQIEEEQIEKQAALDEKAARILKAYIDA